MDALAAWRGALVKEMGSDAVFVFGSLVYRDGAQFYQATSDVDILVVIPQSVAKDALSRMEWLTKFLAQKSALAGCGKSLAQNAWA